MFALVDGNNFYVSCERAFRPALLNRPVVVLSNNDGCAIARSNEAKALGIRMGHPWFQIRDEWPDAGVIALSANFTLYGDMSSRMHAIAAGMGPHQEIYSIDESFLDVSGMRDLIPRGHVVRDRILQWIGVPCGIGIGATKTLAKLANHVAKSADRKPGSYPVDLARVCNLSSLPASDLDAVLAATDVGEVWGFGPRISTQLREAGITNVLQAARMDPATVRRRWSVVVERTVRELQGQPCIPLSPVSASKKEIACTRSFGAPVTDYNGLMQAVTEFTTRAAEKLRTQGSRAGQIYVFVHTSPFRKNDKQYSQGTVVPLERPSADTAELIASALRGLRAIYRAGYRIAKTGVMLLDLQDASVEQGELDLLTSSDTKDSTRLMSALDSINDRYGKGTLRFASAGAQREVRAWEMKQERRTPAYTTDWGALPRALA